MAESFGVDPARYDRTRPAYPEALVQRIVAAIPGPDVLDVGCGTGIDGRQFQAAGCRVLGVDPDHRMADFARRSGVEVEVSTFETWDADGRTFDAVVAGTAWHWVDPAGGAAKVVEVLRPGGLVALFWHAMRGPEEIATALGAVFRRVVPDSPINADRPPSPDGYQELLTKAVEAVREKGEFAPTEEFRYDWERTYTRDEWLDQLPTTGGLTRLPADKLAEVLEGTGAAIDAVGGSFVMRYSTVVAAAKRIS